MDSLHCGILNSLVMYSLHAMKFQELEFPFQSCCSKSTQFDQTISFENILRILVVYRRLTRKVLFTTVFIALVAS